MQSWNSPRENALYNVDGALKQLADREIDLPDNVTAAVAVLHRIKNSRPAEPPTDAIRRAILDGADRATLDRLVLDELGHSRLAAEHRQAHIDAAVRVLAAIRAAHDDIFPQLKVLADKKVEHLNAVNALDTVDVMALVRAGNHRGAQLVAEVDTVAAELEALCEIRDGFLIAGGYEAMRLGHVDASRWRDPDKLGRGSTPAERCLDGLAQGNELWFPTKQEAIEAARPAYERAQRKAESVAQVRRAQNHAAAAFAR